MLHNRIDLQIIIEPNYSGSKPYISSYHLVALLYSLPNLGFQGLAPGRHSVLLLPRVAQGVCGRLAMEKAN